MYWKDGVVFRSPEELAYLDAIQEVGLAAFQTVSSSKEADEADWKFALAAEKSNRAYRTMMISRENTLVFPESDLSPGEE